MSIQQSIVIAWIGFFLSGFSTSYAATVYVDSNVDVTVSTTAMTPGCTLREALHLVNTAAQPGQTAASLSQLAITLDCLVDYNSGPLGQEKDTVSFAQSLFGNNNQSFTYVLQAGSLKIETPMTIFGVLAHNPETVYVEIDGQNQSRIFDIDYKYPTSSLEPKVVFKGLRLVRGSTGVGNNTQGGTILIRPSMMNLNSDMHLQLKQVSVEESYSDFGGAISSIDTDRPLKVDIESSRFWKNSSWLYSGALNLSASVLELNVTDSSFIENSSEVYAGGAIFISGSAFATQISTISLNQSSFVGNTSANDGGAISIYLGPMDLSVQNCTFSKNQVTSAHGNDAVGGAIQVLSTNSLLTFNHNTFMENTSLGDGSAIFIEIDTGNTIVMTNNLILDNQSAKNGGKQLLVNGYSFLNPGTIISENNVFSTVVSDYDLNFTSSSTNIFTSQVNMYDLGVSHSIWNLPTWRNLHPFPQWSYKPKSISSPVIDQAMATSVVIDQNFQNRPSSVLGDPSKADIGSVEAQDFDEPIEYYVSTTSIKNEMKRKLAIYPNPVEAGKQINLELDRLSDVTSIELYNIKGQRVQHWPIHKKITQFVLEISEELAEGYYFIKVSGSKAQWSKKIKVY
ncbi:MAG: T9SS type A sorting domain-containing protein [Bdellovibrionales bacterium]|nr:T9SS type A sorting domain-containing protein [Bdellovibrionales bacterium]